jgi:hypothetical protein
MLLDLAVHVKLRNLSGYHVVLCVLQRDVVPFVLGAWGNTFA